MSDTTLALLESVLSLVLAIGGAVLIPKLRELSNKKIGVAATDMLATYADMAVRFAEQRLGQGTGNAKFDLALSVLKGAANTNNLNVSDNTLQAAIEAAVHELQQSPTPAAVGNVVVADPATVVTPTPPVDPSPAPVTQG